MSPAEVPRRAGEAIGERDLVATQIWLKASPASTEQFELCQSPRGLKAAGRQRLAGGDHFVVRALARRRPKSGFSIDGFFVILHAKPKYLASRAGPARRGSDRRRQLFRGASEALLKARSTVFIIGWDLDSRTRLVGESGPCK
jgi:hypothetical protein